MVQIDTKIPLGTENNSIGNAQKSEHSSSGGLFEMLFSGLSMPDSDVGDILHLSEEDLQSFSVITGMGFINSVNGLIEKKFSEEIVDVYTDSSSSEISEKLPLFGIDLDTLEISTTAENDEPLAGLSQISVLLKALGQNLQSDGVRASGLQQVLVSSKGQTSSSLSGTFNLPYLSHGEIYNFSAKPSSTTSSLFAGIHGRNVSLNDIPVQPGLPKILLNENVLKPFSASDMAALFDDENPDIVIRRVMDGMRDNIEFDVEAYGNKPGIKNHAGDLQNILMRGTSTIVNQSGQLMLLRNQLLDSASQMATVGQIETTDEGRSVLRDGVSSQAGFSGQIGGNASGSFSGGGSGQGSLAQQNAFLTTGGLVITKGELDLMQDKWAKSLAEKIEKSLRDGQQEIDLILKPKNLGKLNLRLAINNHSLNIQIQADNQHVVSLLQDSETRLMQMLDGNGFKSTHLALTYGFGNAPDFGKKQNQSQQQDERNAFTSQNELVKSSKENIMVGADNRSSDYVRTGVDVIA